MKKAVLLINLGTPRSTAVADVRSYLQQFLMDPLVIDIPFLARWPLVHWGVLPRRPQASAAAYEKIWREDGSPLLVYLEKLEQQVRVELAATDYQVFAAMRYGEPSIAGVLSKIKEAGFTELVLLPLYPQYSLAATESSLQECRRVVKTLKWQVHIKQITSFYDFPPFIDAFATVFRESTKTFTYDHVLMSFHGLPERQIKKTDATAAHCLATPNCCAAMVEANQNCYRAQCYETARQLARRLNLQASDYTVCFQSRLGRTPWIKPYTDHLYAALPQRGVRRLAVICPAFVADCLETLEEIAIRGREEWQQNGGDDLMLVPSLNDSPHWVRAVAQLVTASGSN